MASSEVTGVRAAVFVAIMVVMDAIGAVFANNPAATKLIVEVSLFVAAAAWGISTLLPAGWLDIRRTILLSVVLFGSTVGLIWLAVGN